VLISPVDISADLSIFVLAKERLKTHIHNSEAYSNYKASNAYQELQQFKDDFEIARKKMKDELAGAQNPLLVASRDILVFKIHKT
jgi:hypothetical protein